MRYSLLEIVQLILASMQSDEVDSINDTTEAYDIANLVKSVYYDLSVDLGLPEHDTLFQLNASGDNTKPVLMTMPTNIIRLDCVNYDKRLLDADLPLYEEVTQVPFTEFMRITQGYRDGTAGTVDTMNFTNNGETFRMIYKNDAHPTYFCTTDDNSLLFDSYYSTLDDTLQKTKTMCTGASYTAFTLSDGFIPDLDPTQFSMLINRAKVRAFAEIKQSANQEAASEFRRQKIISQKRQRKITNDFDRQYKGYGRK